MKGASFSRMGRTEWEGGTCRGIEKGWIELGGLKEVGVEEKVLGGYRGKGDK